MTTRTYISHILEHLGNISFQHSTSSNHIMYVPLLTPGHKIEIHTYNSFGSNIINIFLTADGKIINSHVFESRPRQLLTPDRRFVTAENLDIIIYTILDVILEDRDLFVKLNSKKARI